MRESLVQLKSFSFSLFILSSALQSSSIQFEFISHNFRTQRLWFYSFISESFLFFFHIFADKEEKAKKKEDLEEEDIEVELSTDDNKP